MKILIDEAGERTFLVPEDLMIPPGEDDLQALDGTVVKGNAQLLSTFERSLEEIETFLKETMRKAAEEAKNAAKMMESINPGAAPQKEITDLLLQILGKPAADSHHNSGAAQQINEDFKSGFIQAVNNLEPTDLPEVDLSGLDEIEDLPIDIHSPEFKKAAEELAPSIEGLIENPEAQESLEEIFNNVTDKFKDDPKKMKDFMDRMEALNDQLFGDLEAKKREERAKDIRNSARDAIRESLLKRGIKPLSENE